MTPTKTPPLVVAIDGPAAAGKGTLAKRLADTLELAYLDSGLLYRATASLALAATSSPGDADFLAAARGLTAADLERRDLRDPEMGQLASKAAALPEVRDLLIGFQRDFAEKPPEGKRGAVLDGRDIGTVICPQAAVKIYVTASDQVRAQRRCSELQERGLQAIYSAVLHEVQERDRRDRERAVAPLKPAPDAVELDTSDLDREEVFQQAMAVVEARVDRAETGANPKA
ncbi:MAG: (d)CMP kinase [Rhodospirillales bacterium]